MDITPFIKELIVLNECVILRGVGGFETSYIHASFDKEKKLIIPPGKKINFHPDWIKDNEVLENYIAESLGISKSKASEFIDTFVQNFYEEIKNKNKVFLHGIGEFSFDQHSNLLFTEIENENYLAESFGLDTLDIDSEPIKEMLKKKKEPAPVVTQKRKLTGWFVTIGVLLLLISVTTFILISTSRGINGLNRTKKSLSDKKKEIIVFGKNNQALEDSVMRSIEQSITERTMPKKALSVSQNQEIQSSSNVHPPAGRYYLVAGSFKNRKNADILKNQLTRKGFNPEIMVTGGNFYRVIIGAYIDRKEAITELRRIRVQIDHSVWLLENNISN